MISQIVQIMIRDYMAQEVEVYVSSVGVSATGQMNHIISNTVLKKLKKNVRKKKIGSIKSIQMRITVESATDICIMTNGQENGIFVINRPHAQNCVTHRMVIVRYLESN